VGKSKGFWAQLVFEASLGQQELGGVRKTSAFHTAGVLLHLEWGELTWTMAIGIKRSFKGISENRREPEALLKGVGGLSYVDAIHWVKNLRRRE